jgi:hypothetical protein
MALFAILVDAGFPEPDWTSIGLVMATVGSFLLGNAILFRHPRQLVEERFAASPAERSGPGRAPFFAIREQIFQRLQVGTGFFYLLAGFALQLLGRFRPLPAGVPPAFPVFWIACIALLTLVLVGVGWWWSSHVFRRYVRAHLAKTTADLEADPQLARELGELFGVESHPEDTVQTYVERLRVELGLPRSGVRGKRGRGMAPIGPIDSGESGESGDSRDSADSGDPGDIGAEDDGI